MTTTAEIAKMAFDAVADAITDVVYPVSVSYEILGAYDPITGQYPKTAVTVSGARGMLDMGKPVKDIFPDYIIGPTDKLLYIEGLTAVPKEGWALTFNSVAYTIKQVLDILDAHATYYVVVA